MQARLSSLLLALAFYVGLILLWQAAYESRIWSPYLFPSPGEVWSALRHVAANGQLFDSLAVTLRRLLIGFGVAFAVGTLIGVGIGSVRWLDQTVGSLVLGLQSLPSIAWLPLALVWFGLSERAIIFVVLMGSVNAIAISSRDGVRSVPMLQRRAAQVFGATRWQTVCYVALPGMLPSMAQGLKLGWSFSWRSLLAGELIYVSGGLGQMLDQGRSLQDMPLVMAVMLVIVAVGLSFDRLLFGPLEGWVRHRWGLATG